MACGLLRLLPRFSSIPVVRTRNEDILKQCSIVVDVGAKYDINSLRFDHHQKEFNTKFDDSRATKLSSAGLVYKHFGQEIIQQLAEQNQRKLDNNTIQKLYVKIYDEFIEHIDGIDNGVENRTGKMRYRVTTNLSSRVGRLNPPWNDALFRDLSLKRDRESYVSNRFLKAIALTTHEFVECVENILNVWLPAREIVFRAFERRKVVHESGQIINLERFGNFYFKFMFLSH